MNKPIIEAVAPPVATPPPKKCDIGLVLSQTVHELLQAAPDNEVTRAVVMSQIQQAVPLQLSGYEQIREWIEFNVEQKQVKAVPSTGGRNTAFSIPIRVSETERGSCNYTGTRSDSYNFGFSERTVLNAADNADSLEELVESLRTHIDENVCNDGELDDLSHEDFEMNSSDGTEISIRESLEDVVAQYLQDNHPDIYERLTE